MTEIRVNYNFLESVAGGYSSIRVNYAFIESISGGTPTVRVNYNFLESVAGGYSKVRIPFLLIESIVINPPEEYMSTEKFPGFGNSQSDPSIPSAKNPFSSGLPGLAFSVHKKPSFRTRINSAASGNEVRNALQQYPIWDFELTYEYLEDSSGANSSLKSIMGFFLSRQGSFDSWLFKDPDDYLVTNGTLGSSDGVTTQFDFKRTLGGFAEKIGQVDTANTITIYHSIAENRTIPATPGPYTITVNEAASFEQDLGVTLSGSPLTKVSGSPASGQYSVNESTGVYTFNSAQQNAAVVISYRYTVDPADYTVTMPNLVIFDSAPATGTISADFQFFFVCRFIEDQMDFEKFYDKLWSLNTCEFRSIIQ